MRDDFQPLVRELTARGVRFVLIGVAGANYFAPAAGAVFTTQDRDLFLPLDPERRQFVVDDVGIPVARLTHIVESKAAAGREKGRLFLATHAEALRQMLGSPKHSST